MTSDTSMIQALPRDTSHALVIHAEPPVMMLPNGVYHGNWKTHADDRTASYTLTTHALAMVAAAYEDAATGADIWQVDVTFDGTIGTAIRARTADDAQAALNALLRAERVKALREAMQIADECDSLRTKMAIKAAMEKDHE